MLCIAMLGFLTESFTDVAQLVSHTALSELESNLFEPLTRLALKHVLILNDYRARSVTLELASTADLKYNLLKNTLIKIYDAT